MRGSDSSTSIQKTEGIIFSDYSMKSKIFWLRPSHHSLATISRPQELSLPLANIAKKIFVVIHFRMDPEQITHTKKYLCTMLVLNLRHSVRESFSVDTDPIIWGSSH